MKYKAELPAKSEDVDGDIGGLNREEEGYYSYLGEREKDGKEN